MAKSKCAVCMGARGRRACRLKEQAFICPVCCAGRRSPGCEGCDHWSQALAYTQQKAAVKTAPRERHFIAEENPQVDAEVDGALALAEGGRLGEAERILAGLLERRPDLHMVQFGMGVVRALQERTADALAHFDRAVAIYPYFVGAWFNKAMAHQKLLDVRPMVLAYRKVVALGDPADGFVKHASDVLDGLESRIRSEHGFSLSRYLELMDVFDKAFAAMQNRDWERALSGFREVVAADPKHVQSHGNTGLCHAFLGRKSEALAALDRALELDPTYVPARTNRLNVIALEEGAPLAAKFMSVEHYKDRVLGRRQGGDRP